VLGSEQQVYFTIDAPRVREEFKLRDQLPAGAEQGEIIAASVAEGVARIDPRSRIEAGDRAVLSVDVERIHYFDPASGTAIAPG